jgi:hypothetical protein
MQAVISTPTSSAPCRRRHAGVLARGLRHSRCAQIATEFSKENAKRAVERMKSGPIRLGALEGASSAIFGKRTLGEKKRQRIEKVKAGNG